MITRSRVLTKERLIKEDVGIGDETLMIGRFIQHDGRALNRPAIRFGNIAQMPDVADKVLGHEFQNRPFSQEAFLVEGRTIPGYSGSPVFWSRNHLIGRPYVIPEMDLDLLGIECAHLAKMERGYLHRVRTNQSDVWVDVPSGMAVVIPAWRLDGLLDHPDVVAGREAEDDLWANDMSRAARPD